MAELKLSDLLHGLDRSYTIRSDWQDYSGNFIQAGWPVPDHYKTAVPMFSYNRPSAMVWNAAINGMIAAGVKPKTACDLLLSKETRWALDGALGEALEAIGFRWGQIMGGKTGPAPGDLAEPVNADLLAAAKAAYHILETGEQANFAATLRAFKALERAITEAEEGLNG